MGNPRENAKTFECLIAGRCYYGGERGIRTLGAAINSTHDFQSCSFSQLGHLSVSFLIITLYRDGVIMLLGGLINEYVAIFFTATHPQRQLFILMFIFSTLYLPPL